MKKYLVITHAFPPFGGGGVQRICKFIYYLSGYNWKATVVAPKENNDSWLDHSRLEELKDVEIFRTGYRSFKRNSIFFRVIRRVLPLDAYLGWTLEAYEEITKNDVHNYQLIFTSGPPHSIHLIGYLLKRSTKIDWVADFRDHFTLAPGYSGKFLKHWANKHFENLVYKNASAIIVNTETNKQEVIGRFREIDSSKLHVIYNGYDSNELNSENTAKPWKSDSQTHYLYLGGLRGDAIDSIFYKMLTAVFELDPQLKDEVVVHVVGDFSRKGSLIEKLNLAVNFKFTSAVGFKNVAGFLKYSDACLTWQTSDVKYKGTIAGKMFDYIGMRKPIFSLGQQGGEVEKIITNNGIGMSADPSDVKAAAQLFIKFHKRVKNQEFKYSAETVAALTKFDRVYQSNQLKEIFNSLHSK